MVVASWAFVLIFAAGAQPSTPPLLRLEEAVRMAVAASPHAAAARRRAEEVGLAEPMLLANLDPRFEAAYAHTNDASPRAAPVFQGSQSRRDFWETAVAQNTLLGTEARLLFRNDRLVNPAPFRTLDPTVDSRFGVELRQPLARYFWGRPDIARRRRARAAVAAAQERLRAVQEGVAASAARAYGELHYARRLVELRREAVADSRRLIEKYEEKRRYGLAEPSDLLQTQASLELQELELLAAESLSRRAEHALWAALSLPDRPAYSLEPPSGPELGEGSLGEPAVLAARPEVAAARLERESLEWNWRVERLDTLPEVNLTASYLAAGLERSYGRSWSDLGGFDHAVKAAGLSLIVPFGFKRERLSRRQAELRLEAAKAEEAAAASSALKELRDAREALALSRLRLGSARRLAELERRKLSAEEANFKRGRSTTDLLLRFTQDIRRAEAERLRAEADEALARWDLARAAGVLLKALP